MPRHRSLTSLCVDLLVFISMFALMGHLSMNFWERFIIQKELKNMKSSLHSLKETINQIGYAYDGLHRELTGLAEKTERNTSPPSILSKREIGPPESKKTSYYYIDRGPYRDIEIEAIVKGKNHTTSTKPLLTNKTAQIFIKDNRNKSTQFAVPEKKKITKIASTMTRYPLKSRGVGFERDQNKVHYDKYYNKYSTSSNQIAKCCKDHGCYKFYENLKF